MKKSVRTHITGHLEKVESLCVILALNKIYRSRPFAPLCLWRGEV